MSDLKKRRAHFSSKLGIIFATVGSAVGLGNIWRFPYETGRNGGGAFIIVYLGCILIIGLSVLIAEFLIGKKAKLNLVGAFRKLAPGSKWHFVGYLGITAGIFILGYYVVVSGWTLEYLVRSLSANLQNKSPEDYNVLFESFISSSVRPLLWMIVFITISHFVLVKGIKSGIEKAAIIMMPVLFVLLIVLAVNSVLLPGAEKGLEFLFVPDFSSLTAYGVLTALGHAFFSLSLGMGCMITYASYFRQDTHISKTAFQVTMLDTLVAVIAGIVIFPAVFAFGVAPDEGPGLVFKTLPNVFQQMSLGIVWSSLFYLMLAIACLTSIISIHEVVTAYFIEEKGMTRTKASFMVMIIVIVLGTFCSLSFGMLKDYTLGDYTFFGLLELISASILLPLGGFFMSIFVGWYLEKKVVWDELTNNGKIKTKKWMFNAFIFILKYVSPIAILIIFINQFI